MLSVFQATTELEEVNEEDDLEYRCCWDDFEEEIKRVKTVFCAKYCVADTRTWCLEDTIAPERLYAKWADVTVDGKYGYEGVVASAVDDNDELKHPIDMTVQHVVDGEVTRVFVSGYDLEFRELIPHGYLRGLAWMKGGTRLGSASAVSLLSADLREMVGKAIPNFWNYE